jgi:hypothetical protein
LRTNLPTASDPSFSTYGGSISSLISIPHIFASTLSKVKNLFTNNFFSFFAYIFPNLRVVNLYFKTSYPYNVQFTFTVFVLHIFIYNHINRRTSTKHQKVIKSCYQFVHYHMELQNPIQFKFNKKFYLSCSFQNKLVYKDIQDIIII